MISQDTPSAALAPAADPSSAPVPRVVVIDDDDSVRMLVVHFLNKRGFATTGFADGKSALAAIDVTPCDVVLTDLAMHETSGVDVIRRLRQAHPALKIVAITGGDSRSLTYQLATLFLGAGNIVTKPFSLPELAAITRRLCSSPGPAPQPFS